MAAAADLALVPGSGIRVVHAHVATELLLFLEVQAPIATSALLCCLTEANNNQHGL